MDTKRPVRRKVVKAWIVLDTCHLTSELYDLNLRPIIYAHKKDALEYAKREEDTVVPCTITYSLPITHRKKKWCMDDKLHFSNFKGMHKAYVVTVLEGNGTHEQVYRLVTYVYNEDGTFIGAMDPDKTIHKPDQQLWPPQT